MYIFQMAYSLLVVVLCFLPLTYAGECGEGVGQDFCVKEASCSHCNRTLFEHDTSGVGGPCCYWCE